MSDVKPESMTREELEATAKDLGLSFPHNVGDDTLRSKITVALGGTPTDTSDPEPIDPEPAATASSAPEKRYEIIVAKNQQDKQAVPVGVNGKTWLIKRGEKVIVPASVVEVLNNAIQFSYHPETLERADIQSYPFQIVREV